MGHVKIQPSFFNSNTKRFGKPRCSLLKAGAFTLLIKIAPPKIRAFIFLSFIAFYFIEHYIDLILFNDRVIFFFLKSPFNKICRQLRSYLAAKNRNLIFEFHCVSIAVLYRYKGFYSFVMLLL